MADRSFAIMCAVAIVAALAGAALLLRPAAATRLLGLPPGEAAGYALRLLGAIGAGFGLTLLSFAIAYRLATG
jgi:hypothetical protein